MWFYIGFNFPLGNAQAHQMFTSPMVTNLFTMA